MINTIIFDFAGVVTKVNFLPTVMKACKEEFGLDEAEFKRQFLEIEAPFALGKLSCKDFWQIVCKDTDVPFEGFAEVFASAYEINPDIVALIQKLKKQYQIVMLSDNFDCLAESVKTNPALEGLFERIFLSNEMHLMKKTPGCFEHVLNQLGKKPDECVFTDDKAENVQPAVALGMHGIHFLSVEQFISDLKALGVQGT